MNFLALSPGARVVSKRVQLISLAAAGLFLLAGPLLAGKYNTVLKIGDPAPAWSGLPGVDGRQHALIDLKKKEVVVVAFTCNSCPYAVAYEDRLIDFVKRRCTGKGAKTALVAINVNKVEADLLPAMKVRAKTKKFNFPYLFDETQKIANAYGATYTPEFFVLNKERKIVYMGALDDNDDPKKVEKKLVDLAVEATLQGKAPKIAETFPVGCAVRYDRSRRRRKKETSAVKR